MNPKLAVLTLICAIAAGARAQNLAGPPELVAAFDPSRLETPESVAIDYQGNIFVSLGLTGEIRRIALDGTQSTHAVLPLGAPPLTPCLGFIPIMGALAIDHQGSLYAGIASCEPAQRGMYRIDPGGAVTFLAQLPAGAAPDGVALRGKYLYVADALMQVVWRVPVDGGAAEVWADHDLLKKDPAAPLLYPGPNGAQFYRDELYVSVSGGFRIVAIHVNQDGSAGAIRVHAEGIGCDDFAFDVIGNLYCTTDPFNTLVRVGTDKSLTPLLGALDGLDGPTAATFGRRAGEERVLYVTNGAFPFFSDRHTPKLIKVPLDIPGLPRP